MLEINDSRVISALLSQIESSVNLPEDWQIDEDHLAPTLPDDDRRWPRKSFRHPALMELVSTFPALGASSDERFSKVYTNDLSRHGVSFYHCQQLYPTDICKVWVTEDHIWDLMVVRCRRIATDRYLIGCEKVEAAVAAGY